MWAFSDAARAALSGGHTAISKVEVWHSGQPAYVLQAVSGSVSADADRPVRRNLTATLIDPTGQLTTGDVGDLLNPYDCEIAVYRGVRATSSSSTVEATSNPTTGFGLQAFGSSGFGGVFFTYVVTSALNGSYEYAPQGVFGLTSRQVSDGPNGLSISITGQDRAMGYQGPMDSALAISAGTPVETAIAQLLSTRNAGLTLDATVTGFTVGPLLFAPDIDVWAEAQEMAASVGGVLFHDRTGQCRFTLAGPASETPVASFAEGGGLLLDVDRAEDSDTIRNYVRVESTSGLIFAVAEDLDPTSPTYVLGRYRKRPAEKVVNQHIGSVQQAQQAATTRLAYELGRSETVSFTAVPNPGLDVQEVVSVHRPRVGLTNRSLVVASLDMPLGVDQVMKVGCRKAVLAQDGGVLPEVAA